MKENYVTPKVKILLLKEAQEIVRTSNDPYVADGYDLNNFYEHDFNGGNV